MSSSTGASAVCAHHPERPAVEQLGGRGYCTACDSARAGATRALAGRAEPAACFAEFVGGEAWRPFERGAQAHWLAHALGCALPPGRVACAGGFAVERDALLLGRHELRGSAPRAGDLWVDLGPEDCGVVERVQRGGEPALQIWIRHLRPRDGTVRSDEFYAHLSGRGRFYR